MDALTPSTAELAVILGTTTGVLTEQMRRLAISSHEGRIGFADAIALAEGLEVPEMGRVGARLAEAIQLRADDQEQADAALDQLDDALSAWLERTASPPTTFLDEARRVLPAELFDAVARVWEDRGRGQRRPVRPT